MSKKFNVTGVCIPERNYMVDVSGRINDIIEKYILEGKYFTINRVRQYGKTTALYLLEKPLREHYIVICLSFETADEYFISSYKPKRQESGRLFLTERRCYSSDRTLHLLQSP